MKMARSYHGCFSVKEQGNISKVYVFGGSDGTVDGSSDGGIDGTLTSSTEVLNVSNLTWSDGPSLPNAMAGNTGLESVDEQFLGFSIGGYRQLGPITWSNYMHQHSIFGLQNSGGNQRWVYVGRMKSSRSFPTAVNAPSSLTFNC